MKYGTRLLFHTAAASVVAIALGGCQSERSAEWYMGHGEEMQAKVHQCQKDPKKAESDENCARALEAFITWARTSGVK